MRLLLISLVLAGIFLLPALAEIGDFTVPFMGFIGIPATGLDYMAIFFHEIGHTITRWSFGYPAIPTFDFQHGGGMTYDFKRLMWLLIGVYAVIAGGFFWALLRRHYGLAALIAVAGGLHLALAFNRGHDVLAAYMGHGAELLVAAFCILRAARGETVGGAVEQYLNMVFGLFVVGRNLILCQGLYGSARMRAGYAQQKGGHIAGDLDRIADIMDVKLQSVAMFSLGLALFIAAATLFLALWLPRHERLGDI